MAALGRKMEAGRRELGFQKEVFMTTEKERLSHFVAQRTAGQISAELIPPACRWACEGRG